MLDSARWCDVYGEEFVPKSGNHKRCSPKCAEIAQKQLLEETYKRGRWIIFNRDGFQCIYCGRSTYGDRAQLHVDHIIPRDAGGEDVAANLATSCIRCNLEKSKAEILVVEPILREIADRNTAAGINPKQEIKLKG